MHRDAHFGSNFDIMLEYYRDEGVGVMPDFDIHRIENLQKTEQGLGEDLAVKVLPLPAVEAVNRSKELYKKLREVYEGNNKIAKLISDLILTEEDPPKSEINALIKEGDGALDALIHLISSSNFFDPLNPGYGRAPMFAARALGKIGNPKAIKPLFSAMGQESFFIDEAIILALKDLHSPAKDFLLKRLIDKPFNNDNEHAAIALSSFPLDNEIAKVALSLLRQEDVLQLENFASYLTCMCEGLQNHRDRLEVKAISERGDLPKMLKNELLMLLRIWNLKAQ